MAASQQIVGGPPRVLGPWGALPTGSYPRKLPLSRIDEVRVEGGLHVVLDLLSVSPRLWVPIIRSWALTRGFALHPGTRNRYEIRDTRTQHRPASRQVNDHGRVSGTHTVRLRGFAPRRTRVEHLG